MGQPFPFIDFTRDSETVARQLIGMTFLVDGVGGIIVETEAYDRHDPASHSYPGPTRRNRVMFGEPGHVYVYRSYGIHWCVNFTCREAGHGAAVLIRALEPVQGIEIMRQRRRMENVRLLCAGPGRLTEALGISGDFNGLPLALPPFSLMPPEKPPRIVAGPRIGISKATDIPWRFGLENSPWTSRPFRKASRTK